MLEELSSAQADAIETAHDLPLDRHLSGRVASRSLRSRWRGLKAAGFSDRATAALIRLRICGKSAFELMWMARDEGELDLAALADSILDTYDDAESRDAAAALRSTSGLVPIGRAKQDSTQGAEAFWGRELLAQGLPAGGVVTVGFSNVSYPLPALGPGTTMGFLRTVEERAASLWAATRDLKIQTQQDLAYLHQAALASDEQARGRWARSVRSLAIDGHRLIGGGRWQNNALVDPLTLGPLLAGLRGLRHLSAPAHCRGIAAAPEDLSTLALTMGFAPTSFAVCATTLREALIRFSKLRQLDLSTLRYPANLSFTLERVPSHLEVLRLSFMGPADAHAERALQSTLPTLLARLRSLRELTLEGSLEGLPDAEPPANLPSTFDTHQRVLIPYRLGARDLANLPASLVVLRLNLPEGDDQWRALGRWLGAQKNLRELGLRGHSLGPGLAILAESLPEREFTLDLRLRVFANAEIERLRRGHPRLEVVHQH